MTYLVIVAVVGLVFFCLHGDASLRTKVVLCVAYAASFGLGLLPYPYRLLFPLAQCGFAIVMAGLAFGLRFLMRDVS